ncbi:TonB-dependent siderophore receptor [Rhizobium sp.]|uniref:TonB-dependent siderophore receptor n=1 Tax=Rhizobium sp. TaxID=391 RepID=UPI0028AED37D
MTFQPRMRNQIEGFSVLGGLRRRYWNGITADLWDVECATYAGGYYVARDPRLFILLDQRGQGRPALKRTPRETGLMQDASLSPISYIPAEMDLWIDIKDVQYVRHLDIHFETDTMSRRLGDNLDPRRLKDPQLVFADQRVMALAELIAAEIANPDPLHDLYGDGLALALLIDVLKLAKSEPRKRGALAPWQLKRASEFIAQAQEAASQSNTTLAPIVLQGEGEQGGTGPVKGYVAKQTTTGSKTDTPINEIPQSVSVIGREELDDRGVVDKVDQALLYTPGVFSQPYGSDPDTDWIYVRGFNASQTGLFLDNLALTNHAFGNFQIDPFMLERVEVLKGPASVLLGGANAGGVVNLVRKQPTTQPYFYTELGIDSNGAGYGAFDLSDKLGGSDIASYRLTGKLSGGNGYSDEQEDIHGFIMPQVTIQPDDATSLNVWAYVSHLDQTHTSNGLLPYYGTVRNNQNFGKLDRDVYLGDADFDIGRATQAMGGYEFEHEFEGGWKFTQNLRYAHLDKRERQLYPFDFDSQTDATILMYADDVRSTADSFNVDNRIENEFDLGGVSHKVMAGIDYRYYRLDNDQLATPWGAYPTPVDPTDLPYNFPIPPLTPFVHQVYTINQVGVYAQDQMKFGDGWIVTLNGRFDYLDSQVEDLLGTGNSSLNDTAWSGRAGIAYEFANGLTPYASVATFFSPLVGASADGALKPEEGEQYEVGVKYEPTWFDGVLTASAFNINKQNFLLTAPGTPDRQAGEVRSRGFEVEGKVNLTENWKAIAAASYTDIEFTDNGIYTGNSPNVVPKVLTSLWLDYTITQGALEGLSLGAGVRYRGKSWADEANTLRVGDATVFDAGIRYEKNDWKASLNVTNLFDKEYVAGCNTMSFCGYGEARTVNFKISKVW